MFKTAVQPFIITAITYIIFSVQNPISHVDGSMTAAFEKEFSISLWSFVPAVVMIALPLLKVGVIKAMTASIVTGLLVACMVQDVPVFDAVRICIAGYESQSEGIGTILNGGGLLSMVEIAVILVISSTYSGIFSGTGMLLSLQDKLAKACSKVGRFAVMVCMSIGIAAIFCNQTIGTLMCCDIMKKPYLDGGGTREELAIDMENSVILIACFIPWSIGCSVPLALLGTDVSSLPFAVYMYAVPLCYLFTKKRWFNN